MGAARIGCLMTQIEIFQALKQCSDGADRNADVPVTTRIRANMKIRCSCDASRKLGGCRGNADAMRRRVPPMPTEAVHCQIQCQREHPAPKPPAQEPTRSEKEPKRSAQEENLVSRMHMYPRVLSPTDCGAPLGHTDIRKPIVYHPEPWVA